MKLSNKTKYNGSGSHRRAILYLIGQAERVFKSEPTTAEIAAWMNVSKTTALKYLRKLQESGELIRSEYVHRRNRKTGEIQAIGFTWKLGDIWDSIEYCKRDYELWCQRVLQVIV